MAKTKKPRSAKQLANDERLRNKAKAVADNMPTPTAEPQVEEEDFVPTEVAEKKAAQEAGVPDPEFVAPTPKPDAEQVDDVPEAPVSPQMPVTPQVDPNLIAAMVAAMTVMQQQNPQLAQATPDQKIEETVRVMGTQPNQNKAVLSAQGVQGITYRYDIEKSHYPDPTKRLMAEPKLANFAMEHNYRFKWSVDGEQFEKHGMTFAEPRFTLELYRLLRDEDNEPTGRMALVARAMQHEDDFVVRMVAQDLGLLDQFADTEEGFRLLRDEIRYHRLQQWLFSIFAPPKVRTFRRAPKQEVIAGKVVEVYDTEELTDHDSGLAKASSLKTEEGIGGIRTPES